MGHMHLVVENNDPEHVYEMLAPLLEHLAPTGSFSFEVKRD